MDENTSLLDVVVLVVIAQALNVWIGAENPFGAARELPAKQLHKFEVNATIFTLGFGFVASILTRRYSPIVIAGLFCAAMSAVYEVEWNSHQAGKEVEA